MECEYKNKVHQMMVQVDIFNDLRLIVILQFLYLVFLIE